MGGRESNMFSYFLLAREQREGKFVMYRGTSQPRGGFIFFVALRRGECTTGWMSE
jgi:hypothetical protein